MTKAFLPLGISISATLFILCLCAVFFNAIMAIIGFSITLTVFLTTFIGLNIILSVIYLLNQIRQKTLL